MDEEISVESRLYSHIAWSEYEEAVYHECNRVFGDKVKKNIHIRGRYSNRLRQIDVLIPDVDIDNEIISIAVDAKHYSKKVNVKIVESFIGMLQDINVGRGLIVTSLGFTKSAIKRAHNSPDGVQVDILSIKELEILQSIGGIIYSGNLGFAIKSPFGWVIDATHREHMLATFYRRGFTSFEEAITKEKEFIYLNIVQKNDCISNVSDLLRIEYESEISELPSSKIEIENTVDNITTRYLRTPVYPTIEITGFKEFDNCILLCVLFCPDLMIKRDVQKLKFMLNSAIPLSVRQNASIT